jgi:hypothetical protein
MASLQTILKAFNDQLGEFLEDIHSIFPEDKSILKSKNSLLALKKVNPKIIIQVWFNNITIPYKEQIDDGNISFFFEKDYSNDLDSFEGTEKIQEGIDRLREPIKNMGTDNQDKCMQYIQNLTGLSVLYHKQ